MSVLIKGMEMPTSCADCRLMADRWCYSVGLEQREIISTVKRPTWCPLVPVPPHGDLIDRDALFEMIPLGDMEHDKKISRNGAIADVCTWVLTAPTIIPEEDGE